MTEQEDQRMAELPFNFDDPAEYGVEQQSDEEIAYVEAQLARGPLAFEPEEFRCWTCYDSNGTEYAIREVVALAGVSRGPDPSSLYKLSCGHVAAALGPEVDDATACDCKRAKDTEQRRALGCRVHDYHCPLYVMPTKPVSVFQPGQRIRYVGIWGAGLQKFEGVIDAASVDEYGAYYDLTVQRAWGTGTFTARQWASTVTGVVELIPEEEGR